MTQLSQIASLGNQLLTAALEFDHEQSLLLAEYRQNPEFEGKELVDHMWRTITSIADAYGFDPFLVKVAWDVVRREAIDPTGIATSSIEDRQMGRFYVFCRDYVRLRARARGASRVENGWNARDEREEWKEP